MMCRSWRTLSKNFSDWKKFGDDGERPLLLKRRMVRPWLESYTMGSTNNTRAVKSVSWFELDTRTRALNWRSDSPENEQIAQQHLRTRHGGNNSKWYSSNNSFTICGWSLKFPPNCEAARKVTILRKPSKNSILVSPEAYYIQASYLTINTINVFFISYPIFRFKKSIPLIVNVLSP
jgi:hypothetical protein